MNFQQATKSEINDWFDATVENAIKATWKRRLASSLIRFMISNYFLGL